MGIVKLIARLIVKRFNCFRFMSAQEELYTLGKSFSYTDYFEMDTDEVKTIIFDSSDFEGLDIIFSPILFNASSGPILIDYYTDVVESGDGTALDVSNRMEGGNASQITLSEDPLTSTLTTRFAGEIVPATGNNASTSNGAAGQDGLPFEIDVTKKHAFTIENTNGASTYVGIKMTWFEIDEIP